jgi:hypothetical protein
LSKVKQYDHATYLFLYFQKPIEVEYEGEKVNVVTNQKEIDEWTDKDISAQGIIFYNIEPAFQVALEGSGRMPRIRTGIDCNPHSTVQPSDVRMRADQPRHSLSICGSQKDVQRMN